MPRAVDGPVSLASGNPSSLSRRLGGLSLTPCLAPTVEQWLRPAALSQTLVSLSGHLVVLVQRQRRIYSVGNVGHGPTSNFVIFIIPYRIRLEGAGVSGPFRSSVQPVTAHAPLAHSLFTQEARISALSSRLLSAACRRRPPASHHGIADRDIAPHHRTQPVGSMLRRRRSSREKRLKMCEQVSSDSYQKGKSYKG
jgi:hypothetical protein